MPLFQYLIVKLCNVNLFTLLFLCKSVTGIETCLNPGKLKFLDWYPITFLISLLVTVAGFSCCISGGAQAP